MVEPLSVRQLEAGLAAMQTVSICRADLSRELRSRSRPGAVLVRDCAAHQFDIKQFHADLPTGDTASAYGAT
jgi:hypothetical protein